MREHAEFEVQLDDALINLPILGAEPSAAITNIAGAVSMAFSSKGNVAASITLGSRLSDAFDVALPRLIKRDTGSPWRADWFADLNFMGHYYALREYLYYTYNRPGSVEWTFTRDHVRVRYSDISIPRQFVHNWNRRLRELFDVHQLVGDRANEVRNILCDADELSEFGESDRISEAFALISEEAEERMRINFDILGGEESQVTLPAYGYADFYRVYKYLLTKMLYHRYYAEVNNTWATFMFPERDLVKELIVGTGLDGMVVEQVLRDLTYTRKSGKAPPMYFPIVKHRRSPNYIIVPERFISDDGLAQFLRIQALKDPQWFTAEISNVLGDSFVDIIYRRAIEAGYFACKGVDLHRFDDRAPDIDLMIWSREPTLGYFAFLIEAKAVIPAMWSKDYLRVLASDSLSKAFVQVDRLRQVLNRPEVTDYLVARIIEEDSEPLPNGVVLMNQLIVSSQNAGMFFEEEGLPQVVDYLTLMQILEYSDGDIVYLLDMLKRLRRGGEFAMQSMSIDVAGVNVSYDVISPSEPEIFPRHAWKSQGRDQEATAEFFASGGELFHPDKHIGFKDGLPFASCDTE